jgi:hypothetical protein
LRLWKKSYEWGFAKQYQRLIWDCGKKVMNEVLVKTSSQKLKYFVLTNDIEDELSNKLYWSVDCSLTATIVNREPTQGTASIPRKMTELFIFNIVGKYNFFF